MNRYSTVYAYASNSLCNTTPVAVTAFVNSTYPTVALGNDMTVCIKEAIE